jgi:hypothetical protein
MPRPARPGVVRAGSMCKVHGVLQNNPPTRAVPGTSYLSYVCFDRRDGEQPRKYVNKSTNKQSIARVHSTPLKISLLLLFHSVWPSAHRNPSIGIKALDQPPSERPMVRQPLAAQSPCAPFVPPRGAPERPAIGPVIRMPARLGLASGTEEIRITMDRPQSPRFAASLAARWPWPSPTAGRLRAGFPRCIQNRPKKDASQATSVRVRFRPWHPRACRVGKLPPQPPPRHIVQRATSSPISRPEIMSRASNERLSYL